MATKTYPEIKSRILLGYKYPPNYPGGIAGWSKPAPVLRNDPLPPYVLDRPVSIRNLGRAVSSQPSFLAGKPPGALANDPGGSTYNSRDAIAASSSAAVHWIIRRAGTRGYTIELETPVAGGYKYLTAPDVCFTPLPNAELALKDQPWPVGRQGLPQKYAVQGPEWYPAVGHITNAEAAKVGGPMHANDGMFMTPGWWPVVTLSAAPNAYTTWKIQNTTAFYNSRGNGGGPYFSFQPANKRPTFCPSVLRLFPYTGSEGYLSTAMLSQGVQIVNDAWTIAPVATRTPAPAYVAPVVTESPGATPYTMTPAPVPPPPGAGPVSTSVSAGNTSLGLSIDNGSQNTNNIANAGQGGSGSGSSGDGPTMLLASLLAQQQQGAAPQPPGAVYPYPNPYAVPPPMNPAYYGATAWPTSAPPSPAPAPASSAMLQQQLDALAAPPTPPPAAPTPWYASTPAVVAAAICCLCVASIIAWTIFGDKKRAAAAAATATATATAAATSSAPAAAARAAAPVQAPAPAPARVVLSKSARDFFAGA